MRRTILVAEDNTAVIEVLCRGLEEEGYDCIRAPDGLEAIRLFHEAGPDAVVLDLNLPGLHGLEVLRQAKLARPESVIVVLTGHGTEQTAIRALKLGADDYLQKPIRTALLAQSLQKNLERAEREQRAGATDAIWSRVPDERLASVFRHAPAALVYSDAGGRIQAVNQAAARLLGRAPEELLRAPVEELADPAVQSGWVDALRREAGVGRGYEGEIFLRGGGGESIPASVTAVEGPEQGHLMLCLRDLSRQRALELHYFEAKKLASLGRVVEGVAHEVRNPLTSIGGFSRKLLEHAGEGTREHKYLEVILGDVQRLEHMVQEIEQYVSFTHRHRPGFAPVDVGAVLGDALTKVSARCGSPRVLVRYDRPMTLPTIYGDEALLGELFEGLAENAFEAMPDVGTLTASWQVEGNWVRMRLVDTGSGIPESELLEIFNPFVTTKTTGAGLGLAKAHMIVEEHSGTIEFESGMGEGTVCSVNLPVDRRRLARASA